MTNPSKTRSWRRAMYGALSGAVLATVGVGGAPVLNERRRPMKLDGRIVVLDKKLLTQICRDHGVPSTSPSGERIVIKARVHLERCSRPGPSLELPDGRVHQESLSCYALVIDELIGVAWHGRRVE